MAAKEFLAKVILGRVVHKDLAIAEKEVYETQGKYNNACQTISVLEEKNRVLRDSLHTSKQEMSSLQNEKELIVALLSQLLKEEKNSLEKDVDNLTHDIELLKKNQSKLKIEDR